MKSLEAWAKRRYERIDWARPSNVIQLVRDRKLDEHIGKILLAKHGVQTRVWRAKKRCRVLPLDQMRGLPAATTRTAESGVYFMWIGPILFYIGQSVNIGVRLPSHKNKRRTRITFQRVARECLRDVEKAYIYYYLPPGNEAL